MRKRLKSPLCLSLLLPAHFNPLKLLILALCPPHGATTTGPDTYLGGHHAYTHSDSSNQWSLPSPLLAQELPNSQLATAHPHLSATNWSLLIHKVQAGELPGISITPLSNEPLPVAAPMPPSKVFTAESTTFSLDSDPSTLPDCLFQMVLNKVFIPLSMLTTTSLIKIEHNEAKFK